MEVKVSVDGIPRVVCGVTEETTCQEVVIALAQALGMYVCSSYHRNTILHSDMSTHWKPLISLSLSLKVNPDATRCGRNSKTLSGA